MRSGARRNCFAARSSRSAPTGSPPSAGNYRFAQELLRQVAYDTLSRRDRKTRHLAAAALLRAAFPGDGDEVAEVIARHYLDALPPSRMTRHRRGPRPGHRHVGARRAARRAHRRPRPGRIQLRGRRPEQTSLSQWAAGCRREPSPAGLLWEGAAQSPRCRRLCAASGTRTAPETFTEAWTGPGRGRTQAIAGDALASGAVTPRPANGSPPRWRCCARIPSRQVTALEELAALEIFSGWPDADRLSAEALVLGQALDVDSDLLADLFLTRGIYLCTAGRRPEGVAYFREGARLATQSGDNVIVGRALLNLSDGLAVMDPAAAAEAARTAATHLRRAGAGITWPLPSPTWFKRCSCSATGMPPRPSSTRPWALTGWPMTTSPPIWAG